MNRCARSWWSWRGKSRASAIAGCRCCCGVRGEVNHKRVHRVYREAGLSIRRKKRKHCVRVGQPLHAWTAANQEWALDFVHDAVDCGRAIRVLSVVDAYTRECLALEVDTSFASRRVTRVLEAILAERGVPQRIRCDNGPELTSRYFLAWCIERQIELVHIQPGRPMQNGRVENFHGKLRDECLRVSWFANLFEARRKIAAWRKEYNQERPHSSLDTARRRSSRAQWAAQKAVEKTGAAPPWKTLRVSHFPQPRRRRSLHQRCRQQPGCRKMTCGKKGAGFPTTAVLTTDTVQLTIDLTTILRGNALPEEMALARRRIRMTFPAFAGFIAGCATGALLEVHSGLWALAFPVLLAVVAIPLSEYTVQTVPVTKTQFACAVSAIDTKASIDTFVQ